MSDSLSARGRLAAVTPLRIDYDAFRETEENRYHPVDNPGGRIPLNIAENRLSWPELRDQIEEITQSESIPDWVPSYTSAGGAPPFRESLAHFLETHLTHCPIDPAGLVASSGATSVIEMTAFVLAEVGDVAVIPAPSYPVYERDLGNFADVERFDLVTHHDSSEIHGGPILSTRDLDKAHETISASGRRFRMLILTSPDNPTGGVYSLDQLRVVADWCIEREIHLVVNEIYGLSLIDTGHPDIRNDYESDVAVRSFAGVMVEKQSEFLHLWYALSKDLGISGFRVGSLWSLNADAITAYGNLNLTHSISNHTQWILSRLLIRDDFLRGYIERNRARLTASYALAARALRSMGVPYVPSRGSLFLWIDLAEFVLEESEDGEMRLWREIFDEAGVLLTPGVGFGHAKRGQFRLVYPCVQPDELSEAMRRLHHFVSSRRDGDLVM